MKLARRKHGSQRPMATLDLELISSSRGDYDITFLGSDGIYYSLLPETLDEMRQLLSQVHIAHHYASP